jgi:hypothetical protein
MPSLNIQFLFSLASLFVQLIRDVHLDLLICRRPLPGILNYPVKLQGSWILLQRHVKLPLLHGLMHIVFYLCIKVF